LKSAAVLSAESPDAVKLSLYSGHDTVIAPVLAALGLYNDDLCIWPPYASRIVFELWQRHGDSSASGSAAEHYIRVIYNGRDLTPNIPSCILEREKGAAMGDSHSKYIRKAPAPHSQPNSPCSLQALGAQIQAMLGTHSSLEAACL
jgi:Histidine phosphatase superfamily (branch 2)